MLVYLVIFICLMLAAFSSFLVYMLALVAKQGMVIAIEPNSEWLAVEVFLLSAITMLSLYVAWRFLLRG